ncbi:MAG: apolipoprotein N-acyltransferase [Gemmatimonadaceae bacterium]|nr:apolipoprotein N-acyltransferase [Gemmatimonadaceae bacterium]
MTFPPSLSRQLGGPWPRAVLSGLLLALAFPCHPENPAALAYGPAWAWIALAPLLHVLAGGPRPAPAFRLGWAAGFVFYLASLYWVAHTRGGGPAVVGGTGLMAVYLAVFTGLFAMAQASLCRRHGPRTLLAAPVLWTAMEYLQSVGELGFPWLLLGHSQAPWPAVVQYAEHTGVFGVSFAAALAGALLALAQSSGVRDRSRALIAAAAVPALAALHGVLVLGPADGTGLRVAVVQNNLGLEKWRPGGLEASFASLDSLSRRAERPGLIVWPETALPCNLDRRADCRRRMQALADELGTPILTGAPGTDAATGEPLNAAFLFSPGREEVPAYAKMHLVPFGERTPLRDRLPLVRSIDWSALTGDLAPAEFARGRSRTLFTAGQDSSRFALLICFESVFPDFVRQSVREGADFLVNITNDSWFGPTAGPYQHAELAVLRAVENRVAIARCATSGVSLFVDRYGRTRQRTELGTADVRTEVVGTRRSPTVYTRFGDWFAVTNLLLAVLLVAGAWWRARRPGSAGVQGPAGPEPPGDPEQAEAARETTGARGGPGEPGDPVEAAADPPDAGAAAGAGGADGGEEPDAPPGEGEMPFLDHLEELRWRLLKALGAVLAGTCICFLFVEPLLGLLVQPYEQAVLSLKEQGSPGVVEAIRGWLTDLRGVEVEEPPIETATEPAVPYGSQLQSLRVMTWFFVYLQVSLLGGFLLALPVVFYQFWRFVAPGLLDTERRLFVPLMTMSVGCFAAGAAVAHSIVLPIGLRFFLSLEPKDMTSQWAVDEYIGFVLRLLFGFGLVFEMPVVSLFLARLGLITADTLRRVRRYAVVAVFLVAAVFTPPDPLSQLMMALPLMVLYEISIWVAHLAGRRAEDPPDEEGPTAG